MTWKDVAFRAVEWLGLAVVLAIVAQCSCDGCVW